jgi:hypothetical protein
MLQTFASRLLRRPMPSALDATTAHVAVCPPETVYVTAPSSLEWLKRLARPRQEAVDPAQRLRAIRVEFAEALDDIPTQHASFLQHRVRCARSLHELWHLRSEMYSLIAVQHNQEEAERRLAPLNRFFPTRSPRSGFAPLDSL